VKVHGRAATKGNGDFLSISTAPRDPVVARWGSADMERPGRGGPIHGMAPVGRCGRGWGVVRGTA
jgi:hypothetical protein